MSHTPHELPEEFPQHVEKMRVLKETDAHFARLHDEYHEINRKVFRAETRLDPMEDLTMDELRKKRMFVKDQIWAILRDA